MPATIGQPAPSFTLKDQDNNEVTLESLRGRKTLVVFIPFPFTGNCEAELCAIRDHLTDFNEVDANVVAITCDTRHVHKHWAEEQGYGFPILSDFWPHGAVATEYGCFDENLGCATRTTYVLDADGVVREIIASGSLGVTRDVTDYEIALEHL
ncbi:MAG: redoxin domain-containing protein [Gammaproteobacteria bacterium]|nr:redoxin domain-containing protein [Gammaproteobacteria bacterium]